MALAHKLSDFRGIPTPRTVKVFEPEAIPQVTPENLDSALGTEEVELRFLNDEHKALFLQAKYGIEVQDFLNTDAGFLIRSLARADAVRYTQMLKTTNPWRRRRVTELQNKIAVAESLLAYLADLLQRGEEAAMLLNNIDNNEE